MKYLFLLSGEHTDIGKEEILSLFDIKIYKLINRLLIADLRNDMELLIKSINRLALTKHIYKFLFECKISDLKDLMEKYDWNSVYNHNFCLRIHNLSYPQKSMNKNSINKIRKQYSEKDLAGYVWRSLSNPKVDLENPKTEINLFFIKDSVYCGLLIYTNNEDFQSRKSHLRPFPHPSSLHPKIAKALVNISEAKENDVLLDPFCGTGGFLIEAGLMNISTVGYDINKIMTNGCTENLKHYKINNYKIKRQNATDIKDNFDCAATDLPYGLNSNAVLKYENWKQHRINKKIQQKGFKKNLENFYLIFLKNLRKKLKNKAVIVFPDYVDYKKLLKQSKFRAEKEFEQYVHRSLTRKIVKVV